MSGSKLFQQDNIFNTVMTRIFDFMLLSVLWLICSIPIITIGASTTALFYMTMKMVRDEEEAIIKGFFKAFRQNFRSVFPLTILFLVFVGILVADFHILGSSKEGMAAVLYGGCIALLLAGTAIFSYAFPMEAKFENTTKNIIVNAAKIAVTHLPQTAILLGLNGFIFLWFLISPETFSLIFWVWIFVGPGVVAYLDSIFVVCIFDEFIPKREENIEELG